MTMWKKFAGGVALSAVTVALAQPSLAQETTSGVRGNVSLANGSPAAGAQISLVDTRTGSTRTDTANGSGAFDLHGLNVGGPFTLNVTLAGQQPIRVEGVNVNLGAETDVNLKFSGVAASDTIVISASTSGNVAQQVVGPTASFSLTELQHDPVIHNDIKDVLQLDPRIFLDRSFGGTAGGDGIQCGGAHPRFTSLTVDGITLSDGFGLGTNNYPSERMPFPFNSINQVSVELAPFEVQYGGFTACNVNAVTKSGANKFHGMAYFDITSGNLRSHENLNPASRITSHRSTLRVPEYNDKRYAASLGGPIIKDRLFFFAAYEKADFTNFFTRGQTGSGASDLITGLDQATYDRIVNDAKTIYGYDPGTTELASPQTDEKYLARVDLNISDRHRAVFSYDHSKAFQLVEANSGTTNFEFSSHLYRRGGVLDAYNGQLFSDWTDNLSTELRAGYNKWDGTVLCQDGGRFGEVDVQIGTGGNLRNIYMGCDRSRQANDLNYTVLSLVGDATYRFGRHTFLGGLERRTYDIFNEFVQDAQGTYTFSSIANFEAGIASQIRYASAGGTNSPTDASAKFSYDINTAYAQDHYSVNSALDITGGLRYEWYTSSNSPKTSAKFVARNGFPNTSTFDGKGILQPRVGFDWKATPDIKVHGGVGLFSGGNPNVWLSNGFTNDGVTKIALNAQPPSTFGINGSLFAETFVNDERGSGQTVNPNGMVWGIPKKLYDVVAAGAAQDTEVDAVDPNFKIPSEWKIALGATWNFDIPFIGKDFLLGADYLYSKSKEAAAIQDLTLSQVGVSPDGQPIYRRVDKSDPDCIANPGTVLAANPACTARTIQDFELTNSKGGYQSVISFDISKSWKDLGLDGVIGYAHIDSKDRSPMTSSVAFSNWTSVATTNLNNPAEGESNYEIPNRFTFQLAYHHSFWDDFQTRATLTGQAYQSKPFSFVFANPSSSNTFGDGSPGNHLFYVPSGPGATDDPKVTYATGFDLAALNAYIARYHLARGRTLGRNDQDGQWNNRFDFKLEQEFPGGFDGAKASGFVIVENIGNLLNDHWGQVYESPFPLRTAVVTANLDATGTKYVYSGSVPTTTAEQLVAAASFWTVKFGVKYTF